ncbi:MAG: hypothetical protein BWK79_09290 [Beggiatoa sp. IS2]|nr:MAG: hypothetical protein BWK79_09290 [Beggiatoa sp. IS2]
MFNLLSIYNNFQRLFILLLLLMINATPLYAADTVTIMIEGVKGRLLNNVRAYLSLEQQKEHPRLSAIRVKRLHQQAPEEIKKALQPFGYYQVEVTTATLTSTLPENAKNNVWKAHYVIKLGQPTIIHHLTVKIEGVGEQDEKFRQLLTQFPIKIGAVFDSTQYEKSKQQLQIIAAERGYFDAQLRQHQVRVDSENHQADIRLIFDTGSRYRFGKVHFQQETFVEPLLQRFLTFQPGDFYSTKELFTFKNALAESGYFNNVDIETRYADATDDRQVPIEVKLDLRPASRYSFAIGYGTDTGARGSLGWERRRINRYGHIFKAEAQLSEIRTSAVARYLIPFGHQPLDYLTLTTLYKDETTQTRSSEILSMAVSQSYSRHWFNLPPFREVIGIEYRDERYSIGSDQGHAKLLMPSIDWSYTQVDDYLYPLHGHKIQWLARGALDSIGSNASFIQTHLNATVIRQFGQKGRIIARGEIGYTEIALTNGEFNELPPSIRFFAGGDRSVRGYDYETLGPRNVEGQNIGGRNLLVGSLEYEHRIIEKWSVATFIDVGNAFNGLSESLKQGAGLGLRWQSPVGLIRVDLAAALSEPGYPLRLHLTIGPDL